MKFLYIIKNKYIFIKIIVLFLIINILIFFLVFIWYKKIVLILLLSNEKNLTKKVLLKNKRIVFGNLFILIN